MSRTLRLPLMLAGLVAVAGCGKSGGNDSAGVAAPAQPVAAAPAPAGSSWTETVAMTPEGGILIGNPAAAVKLVEYGSLTCSHCAEFEEKGFPVVRERYIATGKVSYEFRNFVRDQIDLTLSMLARCQTPEAAAALVPQVYAAQPQFLGAYGKITEADSKRIGALPQAQQFAAVAALGGADEFFAQRGLPKGRQAACFGDDKVRQLVAMQKKGTDLGVNGTPMFQINGALLAETFSWEQLEPKLKTAVGA